MADGVHRWEVCSFCGPTVICGYCGNNCCNGGHGEGCPDNCSSAHAMDDAGPPADFLPGGVYDEKVDG